MLNVLYRQSQYITAQCIDYIIINEETQSPTCQLVATQSKNEHSQGFPKTLQIYILKANDIVEN